MEYSYKSLIFGKSGIVGKFEAGNGIGILPVFFIKYTIDFDRTTLAVGTDLSVIGKIIFPEFFPGQSKNLPFSPAAV